jgi:hypothetical protein
MPIDYTRDDRARRIHVRDYGTVTLAEMRAIMNRQAAEGTWAFATLHDAREMTSSLTAAEVRTVVEHVNALTAQHGPRGPVAIVLEQTVAYGMARMYSILSDRTAVVVSAFRDLQEAERWLAAQCDPL